MPKKLEKRDQSGNLIYSIDGDKKRGIYHVASDSSQFKYCERIIFSGFQSLPTGFYTKRGYGLHGVGPYLLRTLHEKYQKKIALTVAAAGASSFSTHGQTLKLRMLHSELAELNDSVSLVKRQKNQQISREVDGFLASQFPTEFPKHKQTRATYVGGTLAKLLRQRGFLIGLSLDDKRGLERFIPEYLSKVGGTLRARKRLKVVFDTVTAGRKVYLTKVIQEFRARLDAKTHQEQSWQTFLSAHMLLLRTSYAEALEKKSVAIEGKFPDFLLVDPYGYMDVYEIKTPRTTLLGYDKSRKNYYWSTELSKAISQVENYLHQIERHSDQLANDIRKAKSLDLSIVRPRGYIIAGMRTELSTTKMKDDFRILNDSLKNIDVLLYDDLLANLIAFVERVA